VTAHARDEPELPEVEQAELLDLWQRVGLLEELDHRAVTGGEHDVVERELVGWVFTHRRAMWMRPRLLSFFLGILKG